MKNRTFSLSGCVCCSMGVFAIDPSTGRVRLFLNEHDERTPLTVHYESIIRFNIAGRNPEHEVLDIWELEYWYQEKGRIHYATKF